MAGWVIGIGGVLALGALVLFFAGGQPWGTVNDVLLIVTIAALPVLMLAFWELGGLTPTPLALAAQVLGWLAAITWCLVHLLFIAGVVGIDYVATTGAIGAFAVEAVALTYIGLWIGGANLLAGPWLGRLRWLGLITGLGIALFGFGTLIGGATSALTYVGALGYLVLFPVWAFAIGVYLRRRTAAAATG